MAKQYEQCCCPPGEVHVFLPALTLGIRAKRLFSGSRYYFGLSSIVRWPPFVWKPLKQLVCTLVCTLRSELLEQGSSTKFALWPRPILEYVVAMTLGCHTCVITGHKCTPQSLGVIYLPSVFRESLRYNFQHTIAPPMPVLTTQGTPCAAPASCVWRRFTRLVIHLYSQELASPNPRIILVLCCLARARFKRRRALAVVQRFIASAIRDREELARKRSNAASTVQFACRRWVVFQRVQRSVTASAAAEVGTNVQAKRNYKC